jgi:excisionase family DNA binding protein
MHKDEEHDKVTVGQAAAMLGVTKEKIHRLVKKGELSTERSKIDARRTLIPRAQIEAILDQDSRPPASRNRNV